MGLYPLTVDWIQKLVEEGELDPATAHHIMRRQTTTGKNLDEVITEIKAISEERLFFLIGKEMGVPYINLDKFFIDQEVVKLVKEEKAREHNIVPVFKIKNTLTIATLKPMDVVTLDAIARDTGYTTDCVLASPSAIRRSLEKAYSKVEVKGAMMATESMDDILEVIDVEKAQEGFDGKVDIQSIQQMADEAPLIKLVNIVIGRAIEEGASDIHIEPEKERVRIRYRVDGVLHEIESLPKRLQLPILSRIKVMSALDIIETRKPQDGRIGVRLGDKEVDLRISVFPTALGGKVVMRILDKSKGLPSLNELGFSETNCALFRQLIKRPNGIILVTGPTGSGKTSTLYAALKEIKSPEINITTLEDPVEYQIDGAIFSGGTLNMNNASNISLEYDSSYLDDLTGFDTESDFSVSQWREIE